MKENLNIFKSEIEAIKDISIKQFTIKALESLPEYFGKYLQVLQVNIILNMH